MISEKQLEMLRGKVSEGLSEKRFRHVAEVEKMAARLGTLYMPDSVPDLRAAALLHDITKEYSVEEHAQVLSEHGLSLTLEDVLTPKTLHARTATLLIPDLFSEFATPAILSAVRYHTTGRPDMTLMEKLIYLADYIDESRQFEDCVTLRHAFWDKKPEEMTQPGREIHLDEVLVESFDMTIRGLMAEGGLISADTFAARNSLVMGLKTKNT